MCAFILINFVNFLLIKSKYLKSIRDYQKYFKRRWLNGYNLALPRLRSGFDSQPAHHSLALSEQVICELNIS